MWLVVGSEFQTNKTRRWLNKEIFSSMYMGNLTLFRAVATFVNLSLVMLITSALLPHNPSAVLQNSASANAYSSAIVNVSAVRPRLAILNFDDGYKSQFTNAKPILDMYGFKATFFITCNFIGILIL